MKIFSVIALALSISSQAFAYEVFVIDNSTPLKPLFEDLCPHIVWSRKTMELDVAMKPKKVGVGGSLSGAFDEKVYLPIEETLYPNRTQAIHFDMAFYDDESEVLVRELSIRDENRGWESIEIPEEMQVLSGPPRESILVCFEEGDAPMAIKGQVSSRNIDGNRPTLGMTLINLKPE